MAPKPPPTPEQVRRSRIVTIAVVTALLVAGSVVALAVGGDGETIGGFLIGVAAIVAVARVFYEVGIGEDRDRARGRG